MSSHTPGPWIVDGVEIRAASSHESESICVMEPGFADADARLIAAAPDLLEALEMLILFSKPSKTNAVALNNAYQVIAKAKGIKP